jgi:hypothetical protein
MTRIITIASLFILAVLFHFQIEYLAQTIGLSFSIAKMMPYIMQAAFLIILLVESYRVLSDRFSHSARRLIGLGLLIVGGGIAFAIHPIYESDFKHQYRPVLFRGNSAKNIHEGLTMIALPGCPYCLERITLLNRIIELHPTASIHIQVMNQDALALEEYGELTDERIHVSLAQNEATLKSLTGEKYPSFIYIKPGSKQGMIWNNNDFGVAAIDFILASGKPGD